MSDDLIENNLPGPVKSLTNGLMVTGSPFAVPVARALFSIAQKVVERRQYGARDSVLKMDEQFGDLLAFSGRME